MSAYPLPLSASARSRVHRRPGRLLWFTASTVIAALVLILTGPRIETRLFPVFSHQAIPVDSVVRADRSLCWTWERDKIRAPQAINIDVTLDTAEGDTYAPEIFRATTGEPWHTGGALPPGQYTTQFCTTIPAVIPQTAPVRLRQVLTYQGFMGLWMIRVPLPVVIAD